MRRLFALVVRSVLLGSLLAACGAVTASARVIRVPAEQSTIQSAIGVAGIGDTVLVSPGTYAENVNFMGKAIRLASTDGADSTTIRNGGAYGTAVVRIGPNGTISGFTITGGYASFGSGMEVHGTGSVITRNVFAGNAQGSGGFGAAIGGNSASALIDRNVFRNNSCDSQFLSGVVAFVNGSSPLITNNVFVDNPCRAIDMTLPSGSFPQVINNTIVGNPVGIHVDTRIPTSQQIYRNNILYGNAVGLETVFGTVNNAPTWDHNLVFGNGRNYDGTSGDLTGTAGNLSADPRFVNSATRDFHLLPASPAIDAGSPTGAPGFDFDGLPRPRDGNGDGTAAFDMGAFEAPTASHTITASAGPHGSINPSGPVTVPHGADQSFAMAPDAGYVVADVLVDGGSVGKVTSFTFANVVIDHTIVASFEPANAPPDCDLAAAEPSELWPPDGRLVPVSVRGVSDPDGDPIAFTYTVVTQDATGPQGRGEDVRVVDGQLFLRAERSGTGNGRVYQVRFVARDGKGGACEGTVTVNVPHDHRPGQAGPAAGQRTNPMAASSPDPSERGPLRLELVSLTPSQAAFLYELPRDGEVQLTVFDVLGRRVATLVDSRQTAGTHVGLWNVEGMPSGIYLCRLQAGGETRTRSVPVLR